jgi:hypothetical protein
MTKSKNPVILSIIRLIKSRRIRSEGHIAHMRDKRNAYRILMGKREGSTPLGGLDFGDKIILKWIL